MLLGIEAEAGDPLLRIGRPDRLQDADRDQVLRLGEAAAQRHRAVEGAVVVLRLPGLASGRAGVEEERRVVDHGRGGEALLERRRVDERLEARAGLAPGLGHVVELALRIIEAADHGANRSVLRVHRHEGAFDLGQLRDRPVALGALDEANHGAGPDLRLRIRLRCQRRRRRLQAVAGDRDRLAALHHGGHLLGRRLDDDGGLQLVVVGEVLQRLGDPGVELLGVRGQVDISLPGRDRPGAARSP